ncbi:MAG TPA: class I SAM-dependent methyltransferase [Gammaproteobacteria bacterium]|nr:class I SAM-dependent methyltransferase [Gammaproteobacteria bacterium]
MNSLHDPKIARVLQTLHDAARHDPERRAARSAADDDSLIRMGDMYLAVSPGEGRLLYLLARGCRAVRLVEFGASFGISTTYLAAAARDNGGALITTEVHPDKCAATRRVLAEAGLENVATVLEGDARETLTGVEGPIDFVFLDGWKSLYLPVLEILLPKLETGTLIVADNIDHEGAKDYAARVRSGEDFVSHTLGKQEISAFTGAARARRGEGNR